MNNTFAFNRFGNLLLNDGKMYIRNFWITLIVLCCLPAIFWIVNILFGTNTDGFVRLVLLCLAVCIALMLVPSKVYGHANLSREGVGFAMMPVSSLEKFISMFIYCAVITPVIVFFGGYVIDALLSLFPIGGFEKPIHLYTLNELVDMTNDVDGVVSTSDSAVAFSDVFPIGAIRASFYAGIIQWAAIFMLGNMLFKKHKAGKTFVCYLGVSYVLSTFFSLILFSSGLMQQWMQKMSETSQEEMVSLAHNSTIWGMIVSIVVTVLLLFFTYRKIKTQKY